MPPRPSSPSSSNRSALASNAELARTSGALGSSVRPRARRASSERRGVELEPAQPAVHLRACLAGRARDRADVARVLAKQREQLLALELIVARELERGFLAHGRRQMLDADRAAA